MCCKKLYSTLLCKINAYWWVTEWNRYWFCFLFKHGLFQIVCSEWVGAYHSSFIWPSGFLVLVLCSFLPGDVDIPLGTGQNSSCQVGKKLYEERQSCPHVSDFKRTQWHRVCAVWPSSCALGCPGMLIRWEFPAKVRQRNLRWCSSIQDMLSCLVLPPWTVLSVDECNSRYFGNFKAQSWGSYGNKIWMKLSTELSRNFQF